MKYLHIILILLVFCACRPAFVYVTDEKVQSYGPAIEMDLDDYSLYTRQIVMVKNKDSLVVPMNGRPAPGAELLEIEYLFVNEKDGKVLVINNIANRYKRLYNSPDKISDLGLVADTLKSDIWYYAQFRFGQIDGNGEYKFAKVTRDGLDHYWGITKDKDSLIVKTISVGDNYGRDVRSIDQAFSLGVVFVKSDPWKVVFKRNKKKQRLFNFNKDEIPEFELDGQKLYYHSNNGSPVVVFRFKQNVSRHFKNVSFPAKRLYAAP